VHRFYLPLALAKVSNSWLFDKRLTVAVMELIKEENTPIANKITHTAKSLSGWRSLSNIATKGQCNTKHRLHVLHPDLRSEQNGIDIYSD